MKKIDRRLRRRQVLIGAGAAAGTLAATRVSDTVAQLKTSAAKYALTATYSDNQMLVFSSATR